MILDSYSKRGRVGQDSNSKKLVSLIVMTQLHEKSTSEYVTLFLLHGPTRETSQ